MFIKKPFFLQAMARLRKGVSYRKLERPYTRKSKYQAKSYVRAIPANKIVRYVMGEPQRTYDYQVELVSKEDIQLRHNAIESARLTVIRYLEKNLGKGGYCFRVMIYPHHVLRENPLASGAGADRMSTGMQKSFGKSISLAAQVHEGKVVFRVEVNEAQIEHGRKALHRCISKFPNQFLIRVVKKN